MVSMPHWPIPLWHKQINYDLAKIASLLKALGDVHLKLPPVIHVAGTNGKGSTLAFMRAILEAQGLKVHCYTSPHLVRFNERIVLAGKEISDNLAYSMLERTRIIANQCGIEVTFFEGVTAAAFLAFSEIKADVTLVEVGLGGRLDATNLVIPELTVITSISLDHTMYLGDKIWQIAAEKAGIMKKNSATILSLQTPDAFAVFEHQAAELGIPLIAYEYDFAVEKTATGFIYQDSSHHLFLPKPSLIGDHQYINAATAIAAMLNFAPYKISEDAIKKGLVTAKWPARLQQITSGALHDLLPDNFQIFLDGAHNQAGAHALSMWLDNQPEDIALIVGLTKGRDIKGFLQYFLGKAQIIIGMLVESEPSSYQAEQISNAALALGFVASPAANFIEAVELIAAQQYAHTKIVLCGSLYLAGDALKFNG